MIDLDTGIVPDTNQFGFFVNASPGVDTLVFVNYDSMVIGDATYNLRYRIQANFDATIYEELDFTVTFSMSTCTKTWQFPSGGIPETSYIVGSGPVTIDLTGVDITNCRFTLSATDVTTGVAMALNADLFTLQQPVLLTDTIDSNLVSVTQYGALVVDTSDLALIGTYTIRLEVLS